VHYLNLLLKTIFTATRDKIFETLSLGNEIMRRYKRFMYKKKLKIQLFSEKRKKKPFDHYYIAAVHQRNIIHMHYTVTT